MGILINWIEIYWQKRHLFIARMYEYVQYWNSKRDCRKFHSNKPTQLLIHMSCHNWPSLFQNIEVTFGFGGKIGPQTFMRPKSYLYCTLYPNLKRDLKKSEFYKFSLTPFIKERLGAHAIISWLMYIMRSHNNNKKKMATYNTIHNYPTYYNNIVYSNEMKYCDYGRLIWAKKIIQELVILSTSSKVLRYQGGPC